MRNLVTIALLSVLISCGGSLSDDQKKKIKEDMAQHKIVRVTDAEITMAAFEEGRAVVKHLAAKDGQSSHTIDSLSKASHAKIKWLVPGATNALEIEKQLVEAYLSSSVNGGTEDNIQRLGEDSLLYTKPVTEKLADGSETVKGIWSIRLSKKDLILGMNK